jgi:hypothetical protein
LFLAQLKALFNSLSEETNISSLVGFSGDFWDVPLQLPNMEHKKNIGKYFKVVVGLVCIFLI